YSFPINSLITSDGVILGQLQWEDNNRFSVFINKEKLQSLVKIHTSLWFGIGSKKVHSMYLHGEQFSSNAVELSFNNGKLAYVLRINKKKVYTLSIVQALPIYNISHKLKILIADFISKNIPKFFRKQKVNLFFEKESSKASESAASVFEKIHFDKTFKSRNYFILDSNSEDYRRMKKIFKRKIVKRFSLRHYVYLFQANAFISSELSNHVIASRVFSNKLSSSISKTP